MAGRPNQLSVKVTGESRGKKLGESQTRKTHIGRLLTFELLSSWIRKMNLDEYTTEGLINLASKYPTAALPSFRKNVNLMIQRVRSQRQKDQQGEESYESQQPKEKPAPRLSPLKERANQVFDTGPQRVSITEEDLREDEVPEQISEASQDDEQQKSYEGLQAILEDSIESLKIKGDESEGEQVEEPKFIEDIKSTKSITEDFH